MIRIQFLWWEDCPSHPEAWQRLRETLDEIGVEARIERVEIQRDGMAIGQSQGDQENSASGADQKRKYPTNHDVPLLVLIYPVVSYSVIPVAQLPQARAASMRNGCAVSRVTGQVSQSSWSVDA